MNNITINCKLCDKEFVPFRKGIIFCNKKCNSKHWRINNKARTSELRKKWREENPHKAKEYRNTESARKYKREYESNKKKNDINHKIACNLRSRLYQALMKNQKVGSAVDDLGCSIEELKKHLENQFQEGMTWDNYGKWHIDHIKPLANYDLTNRIIFLELCSYKNLQPLWLKDNLSKSNKEN